MISNNLFNNIYTDCLNTMDIHINTQFSNTNQLKLKKIIDCIFSKIHIQQLKQVNINLKQDNHFLNILKNLPNLSNKYKSILNLSKKEIYGYYENNVEFYDFLITQNLTNLFKKLHYQDFPTDILNQFISPKILDNILNLKFKKTFESQYLTNKINLEIFYNNSLNFFSVIIIFIKIYALLEINNIQNQNFTIILFLTKCKKQINESKTLTSNNVNSGLTFSSLDSFKIYIFREEEAEKVIIHELIHAMNIDINFKKDFYLYENQVKCHFNVSKKNKVNIFEAFTESFAVYYNTLINCILTNTNFQQVFTNEIKFSILQAIKILKFYNLPITNFFKKDTCFSDNENWIEKSSILAYYFLKAITIINMNQFINQDINNNSTYLRFLIDNSEKFINLLVKYESLHDRCFSKSLRMTLYDLKVDI